MFLTIIIAFFSIITLLIIHEFGHFIVAKKCGFRVEEFGIGYPPRLWGKKYGETIYSINLLPFGAHVRIPEVEGEEARNRPLWQRMLVLLGGVVSFWLVAIILLSIVFSIGTSQAISDEETGSFIGPSRVQIVAVASDSPAEEVGIRAGDIIVSLKLKDKNDEELKIDKVRNVQEFIEKHKGQEIVLTIERLQSSYYPPAEGESLDKDVFEVSLTPRVVPPEGEGAMGVALIRTAQISYPIFQAVISGVKTTINLTQAIVIGLVDVLLKLIQGKGLPQGVQLMGPIGIGSLVAQAVRVGPSYFLNFIAIISIYLAVFNLLPIPALDGGRLLFLGIEKIKGSPVNQKIEENIIAGFSVLLIALMIWVTIKDIARLF